MLTMKEIEEEVMKSPLFRNLETGEYYCDKEWCKRYEDDCSTCIAHRIFMLQIDVA